MLVLTRETDQTIMIGRPHAGEPPIEVTIVGIRGVQVRIGIVAPHSVSVDQSEVRAAKHLDPQSPSAEQN